MKRKHTTTKNQHIILAEEGFSNELKERSDHLMNYFLGSYFLMGLILASVYDTWFVAISVGGLSLLTYYVVKAALPESKMYQYILGVIMGIFMAQYIYQMHGLFEMHFIAFISSAVLITYQNWKLQLPLTITVVLHHIIFNYLQFEGISGVYFTQGDFMDLQTFTIHVVLAAIIFYISGLWAYQLKKYSSDQIKQTYELARLQESELQKNELLKANQELDKFVYSVSHDLRAPLSSMKGVIEICEDETTDESLIEKFNLIKGSIQKLDGFILDILDYSRNSRLEIKKQKVNFKEMMDEISANLKYMASNNQRQVALKYNIRGDGELTSDKGRISILLNNLISNAIRYQNPDVKNPVVEVEIDMAKMKTGIVVKDNGIGIGKENQIKIFDMFFRVAENSVGSGLGLYLVKEIVDKLEGKIDIDSEIGVGTKFSVVIPNSNNVIN